MRPALYRGLRVAAIPAVLALTWGLAQASIEINQAGWKFPNIITSAKEIIRVSDRTPLIPGKETLNKGYRRANGTRFMTYEIEGRIFGVEIDEDGKAPFEFSIMDTDGDGKFETRIVHEEVNKDRAYVPQWVIDHYYRLHPELKNPSPSAAASRPPSFAPPTVAPEEELEGAPPAKSPPPPEVRERPTP